jgi:CDP-4-dehydro-6-deoxyglucose reductase
MESPKEKVKPVLVDAKLISKKMLTADVFEMKLESSLPFTFLPGQFVSILVPGAGPGGRDLRRAYSIASSPELMPSDNVFELCVKLVEGGPGTNYLNNLQIGESFKGHVPFGDFVYKTPANKHVIFIATGTGIAPFRSMVLSKVFNDHKPLSAKILFGARDANDLFYGDEMVPLLGEGFIETLSRPSGQWNGFNGRVTDWLRQNAQSIDWKNTEFYLCGNGAMIDEVKSILNSMEVEKSAIHQEVYYKPKAGETHASQD